jgi:hypothetical protein
MWEFDIGERISSAWGLNGRLIETGSSFLDSGGGNERQTDSQGAG